MATLGFNTTSMDRIKSIFAVQVQSEQFTSADPSNAGRLHMWKVALDFFQEQPFFGTGFESTEVPLRKFIENKGAEYSDRFTKTEFSYRDQHSSYLNTLVQMGALFFTYCWIGIIIIFYQIVIAFWRARTKNSLYVLAGSLYCFIVFIFYSAFNSYEAIYLIGLLTAGNMQTTNDIFLDREKLS